jgi:tetratricopeptide (TPR) repeat protein
MAIEGPLRELGIHDVFQMLDLSRKTGALRVTSAQRDNEGTVLFDRGKVISASIRSSPTPLGTMLVRAGRVSEPDLARATAVQASGDRRRLGEILLALGAISARELERQVRLQIEAVVFELMSWRDGFFSFEERDVGSAKLEASVQVSTESLLMEGARRIDEWSRIADKVPNLAVIPILATVDDKGHAPQLDLLPNEWEVLAIIDGMNDLRGIAATLGRSEFDVAKVVYGLLTTGVIDLKPVATPAVSSVAIKNGDPRVYLEAARTSLAAGRAEEALSAARSAIGAAPKNAEARLTAARALRRLRRVAEASDELRRAAELDPGHPDIQLELGYAAVCQGDLRTAVERWEQFLRAAPGSIAADEVRDALTSAARLSEFLETYAGV